jgi:hypothetical protein
MTGGTIKGITYLTKLINVSAGGNAEIHASTLVDAKVAGGSIYIYGSPQINKKTLFGGTIIEKIMYSYKF